MNTVTTMIDHDGEPARLWLGDIEAIENAAAELGKVPSDLTQTEIRSVVFEYRDNLWRIERPSSLYPDATMHVSDTSKDPDDPMNMTHTTKVFGPEGRSVQITKEGPDPWRVYAGHLNLREDIPTSDARAAAELILAAVAEAERRSAADTTGQPVKVETNNRVDLTGLLLEKAVKPEEGFSDGYLSLPPVSREFPDVFATNDDVGKWKNHEWIVEADSPFFAADYEDTERFAAALNAAALQARILNSDAAIGIPVGDFAGDITELFEVAGEIEIDGVVYVAYVRDDA